jgi:hypothetical protein
MNQKIRSVAAAVSHQRDRRILELIEKRLTALMTYTPVCDCKSPLQTGGIGAWCEPDPDGEYINLKDALKELRKRLK